MKIRSDYVTNSSSSSFILSFKNEDSIYNTLKEQFPKNIERGYSYRKQGYLGQLLEEIEDSQRLTKEDIAEIVQSERYHIRWELEEKIQNEKGMSYSEVNAFLKTKEGQRMLSDAYKKELDDIMQIIGEDEVIVQVEHGGGGEGEDGILEHEILPNLECTVVRFSHH